MNANIILGIDFGSQYIRSCAFNGESFEVVYNSLKKATTPSHVSFGNEIFVGERATKVVRRNRVTGHMNILGRTWSEILDRNLLGKNIVNVEEHPEYIVTYRGEVLSLKPEIITAIILDDILNQAQIFTDANISGVVISIPLHFNQAQRQAVLDSANISRIPVLQLINETTAAAISYFNEKRKTGKVLVYHMGTETFDFSVINLTENGVSVLNFSGGYRLCGAYINEVIYDWVSFQLEEKVDDKTEEIIYDAIESAKIDLMFLSETSITDDSNIDITLKRNDFNSLIYSEVISKTIDIINHSLDEWGIDKTEIGDVILTGGCCKMEILRQSIEDEFPSISLEANYDNIVSTGAAVFGALLKKQLPDAFEVNEYIDSSIVLNYQDIIQKEKIEINLDTVKNPVRKKLGVFTGDGSSYVMVNYTIDHNRILKLEGTEEQERKDEDTIDTLRKEKEYLTSQNISVQEIKKALNQLRDIVVCYESIVNMLRVPKKYKDIFQNVKKKIIQMKAYEDQTIENINNKGECVKNYVDFLRRIDL